MYSFRYEEYPCQQNARKQHFSSDFPFQIHHSILLRLIPFDRSVDREGWRFEHPVNLQRVLKTFLGPGYLRYEDGVD